MGFAELTTYALGVLGLVLTGVTLFRPIWGIAPGAMAMQERATAAAGLSGLAGIVGGALALTLGGPTSLTWMWLGTATSLGLVYAEVRIRQAGQQDRPDQPAQSAPSQSESESMFSHLRELVPRWAALPAIWIIGALMVTAAFATIVMLPAQQIGSAVVRFSLAEPIVVGLGFAICTAGALLGRRVASLRLLGRINVLAIVGFVVVCLVSLALSDDVGEAFGALMGNGSLDQAGQGDVHVVFGGFVGGSVAGIVQAAAVRTVVANQLGLGLYAAAAPRSKEQRAAFAALAIPVINTVVLSTLTAVTILAAGVSPREELDHRSTDGQPEMYFLERAHSIGASASLDYGQIVKLPEDSPLEPLHRYPMFFRANPRGGRAATLHKEGNWIDIPAWQIAENIDTIIFRNADPEKAKLAMYDRRIPARREEIPDRYGNVFYRFHPADPEVDLRRLSLRMVGPFLNIGDFAFEGTVASASNPRTGEYLAMFEQRDETAAPNPVLRNIVADLEYRGPYFAGEDMSRPPMAFAAIEGLDLPLGHEVDLRFAAPRRGLAIGSLNPLGELVTPAWTHLARTESAVLRHREDPDLDLEVRVNHELGDDGFLRFTSAQPEIVDFGQVQRRGMKDYSGPYLLVPEVIEPAVVRKGSRLPVEFEDRLALVPLHPLPEPEGGSGELYRPHPKELIDAGMLGPFRAQDGLTLTASAFRSTLGRFGSLLGLLLFAAMALATLAVGSMLAGRVARDAFGRGGGLGFAVTAIVGIAAAPLADTARLLSVVDPLACMGLIAGGLLLLAGIGVLRRQS